MYKIRDILFRCEEMIALRKFLSHYYLPEAEAKLEYLEAIPSKDAEFYFSAWEHYLPYLEYRPLCSLIDWEDDELTKWKW